MIKIYQGEKCTQQENMCCYKTSMSCRKVVMRHLPIIVSDGMANERKEIRRSRIKSGMTPLFNNNAFTLIELLVVVLIIGILAAVALPQYQKAVEKSKAAQALTMLKTVYEAAEAYQLVNGTWPRAIDELSVDVPWTGGATWRTSGHASDEHSNQDWSLQLMGGNAPGVLVGRLTGKYAGAGFGIFYKYDTFPEKQIVCMERIMNGLTFSGNAGDYCQKLFRGTYDGTGSSRVYKMP